MPVPLRFFGEGKDTTLVFNNTFSGQIFDAKPGFTIDSMQFDPDKWLISANNTIVMGIASADETKPVKFFPNPAQNFIVVQCSNGEITRAKAISPEGRKLPLKLIGITSLGASFDISGLSAGMYILQLEFGKTIVNKKLIVY